MSERLPLGDGFVVALAIATATGAWIARDVPLAIGALGAAVGALRRNRFVFLAGLFLLASGLAAQAWQSVQPLPERVVSGRALLVSDPEPITGGVRVWLELEGRRFDAWARSGSAGLLRSRAAGELVEVEGRTEPLPDGSEHLKRRHIAERLQVERVGRWWPGSFPTRAANGLRRLLDSGARSLAPSERALYAGFVLGDDRGQDPEIADAFEASGLTHLLAVSGENVGFVVLLARPLLARLGLRTRVIVTIAILMFFAMLTRFEPSVVRATAMAVVSVLAVSGGLPISGVRILALAVIGVLLVDPMLVGVVGFQLSVLASLAIIVA
ncbi:MAG: competence protein ComEC family protein, partial [Acidimicrobiales bacterium]|nr:competence protein ComEC family protein [Acidimicrobiales bacterium]